MPKLMLVEDDNNLREIYEARLQAEGYEVVSARDGEEALVVAKAEKPDLIISDVMMPKISGFEMLDILRNTEGLKEVKVVMLTALGQSDDQQRADKLGADRYLVKSQVTLEDIVKVTHELLGETATGAAGPAAATAVAEPPSVSDTPTPAPTPSTPAPAEPPIVATTPEPAVAPTPVETPVAVEPEPVPTPAPDPTPQPEPTPEPAAFVQPPEGPAPSPEVAQSTAVEEAAVEAKIEDFVAGATDEAPAPDSTPKPVITIATSNESDAPAAPTTPAEPVESANIDTTELNQALNNLAVKTAGSDSSDADDDSNTGAPVATSSSSDSTSDATDTPATPTPDENTESPNQSESPASTILSSGTDVQRDETGAEVEDKPSGVPKPLADETKQEDTPRPRRSDDKVGGTKKVIQPLPSQPKKDITELLAAEEANHQNAVQPGTTYSPQSAEANKPATPAPAAATAPAAETDATKKVDPNSIAL